MENAMRDYQSIAALDTYGVNRIDGCEYEAMGVEEHIVAEAEVVEREENLEKRKGAAGSRRSFVGHYRSLRRRKMMVLKG
eukprot:15348387-Ditylum_brightwellii.AAC.1